MKEVIIGNLSIGDGRPKICVPIVGETEEEIVEQSELAKKSCPDLAELRIDYYRGFKDITRIEGLLQRVHSSLGGLPLLFTCRTKQEGGRGELSKALYRDLLFAAAKSGSVDLVDIELQLGDEFVKGLVKELSDAGAAVVISNHNFVFTEEVNILVGRLLKMQELGGNIAKIAMMPNSPEDVLKLLAATCQARKLLEIPIVTMSMGKLGAASRLCGQVFGSSITFASAGKPSAPGQMGVSDVRKVLGILE